MLYSATISGDSVDAQMMSGASQPALVSVPETGPCNVILTSIKCPAGGCSQVIIIIIFSFFFFSHSFVGHRAVDRSFNAVSQSGRKLYIDAMFIKTVFETLNL